VWRVRLIEEKERERERERERQTYREAKIKEGKKK